MFCGFAGFGCFSFLCGFFVCSFGLIGLLEVVLGIFLLLAMGMGENVQGSWCSQGRADPGV